MEKQPSTDEMAGRRQEQVIARYAIETPLSLEAAAAAMAGASTATFVDVPGLTDQLRQRVATRIERIVPRDVVSAPGLPGSRSPATGQQAARYQRGEVVLSFPIEGMGTNLAALISMIMGNFFALRQVSGIRLVDLELPDCFARAYPGPQFGIEGTRRLTGVHGRPIIGTIIKPNLGLSPEQTAEKVRQVAEAGVDFIKDDEVMVNPPHSPIRKRVAAVMRVINEFADRTGKKVMYAFNISDEVEAMLRHHDAVVAAGGTCVMVSVNSVGYMGVLALRRRCQLPIHAHRNGWDMLTRCPHLGIEFAAWQKLWRLIGVDHLHVNGLGNKFWEPDDSVVASIHAVMTPLFGGHHIMPVIGSGQWAGQAPRTFSRVRTQDLIYLAGGGIFGHPAGAASGVMSIRQAWEAAQNDVALETCATTHVELRQALEKFGSLRE
ncbi:MAG TPA: ribulose-bisphosphate carboxylase large subunit family protein [Phycisphaerae bacterium]|nr:ribulose-bisphosphate carboxylase large subunit family protein [Phycisphaerae bacterium]HRR84227.1 ribulose-bisphosphate carboxylase large subunit family protein [Phycisphaerae bacterium]